MIIIIDNYDSFTYNLVQYFKQMDKSVLVYRNDQVTVKEIYQNKPNLIVLSPGPGSPEEGGVCRKILREFSQTIPILGVCLGHQLIVDYFGGKVEKGAKPMQGKVTQMSHDGRTVFEATPSPLRVTRYHSLHTPSHLLPTSLEVSAVSEDGVVMAVRHRSLPIEGIQFHPESIMTEYGFEMLENVLKSAIAYRSKKAGMV